MRLAPEYSRVRPLESTAATPESSMKINLGSPKLHPTESTIPDSLDSSRVIFLQTSWPFLWPTLAEFSKSELTGAPGLAGKASSIRHPSPRPLSRESPISTSAISSTSISSLALSGSEGTALRRCRCVRCTRLLMRARRSAAPPMPGDATTPMPGSAASSPSWAFNTCAHILAGESNGRLKDSHSTVRLIRRHSS